jgi:hypothetical protein
MAPSMSRLEARWKAVHIGTPQHFRWLEGIIKAVLILNLFDAVLTLMWVKLGLAYEKNVLIRPLVDSHAVLFVGAKITLASLGMFLLWRLRHCPLAVVGIFGVFLIHYGLFLYHLRFASGLLWYLTVL